MANYAFISVRKISSPSALAGAYKHNYRIITPANVNPELSHLNDEAVHLDAEDYNDAFDKKLKSLEYYKDHTFRKDGVRAFEITLEYSPEAAGTFDVEAWKKANVEWLQEKFNNQYGDNVVSVVFHYDEGAYEGCGAVHGHAIIIPVDNRGHICAKSYINGKYALSELQTSYAKKMEQFGLQRGIEYSRLKHEDIKAMYAKTKSELDRANVPVKYEHESDKDYAERLKQHVRETNAAHIHEVDLYKKEIREIKAQNRSETEKDSQIAWLQGKNKYLSNELEANEELIRERGGVQSVIQKAENWDLLNYAIQNHPDESLAIKASNIDSELLEWAEEEKKKNKKKELMSGNR